MRFGWSEPVLNKALGLVFGGMTDTDPPPSLDDLSKRLKDVREDDGRGRGSGALSPKLSGSAMDVAFRVGVELAAGVAVGVGIGYGLDLWLGTSPWLLIVFFFLGSAGGMMNVWRAANGVGLAAGYADQLKDKGVDGAEDGDTHRNGKTTREG